MELDGKGMSGIVISNCSNLIKVVILESEVNEAVLYLNERRF